MVRIGRAGVVLLMARVAQRAVQIVVVVDVAIGTLARRYRVRTGQCKSCAVVIERRIQPRTRVVALIAGLREVRRHVIRVSRALVILQVAGDARRSIQVVVVVDVAISALPWRNSVHAGQGKRGQIVIKRRIRP